MSNILSKAGVVIGATLGGAIIVAGVLTSIALPFAGAYFGATLLSGVAATALPAMASAASMAGLVFGGIAGFIVGARTGKVTAFLSVATGVSVMAISSVSGAGAGIGVDKLKSVLKSFSKKASSKPTITTEDNKLKTAFDPKAVKQAESKAANNNSVALKNDLTVNKPYDLK